MASLFSGIASMIQDLPKLEEGNWNVWKKAMAMVFLAVDLEGIAGGEKPADSKEQLVWEKSDKKMLAFLFMAISPDLRYLIDDQVKASTAWAKLKEHFEHTSMATRMNARLALYDITHDPSQPISVYFHTLDSARSTLTSLGVTIDDTEFKDILLMRLHSSYHPVRLSILSQKPEPGITDIKSLLISASSVISAEITPSAALAARAPHSSRATPDPVDDKGLRWCDPTAVGVCHRCGRSGHTAARCMYNMPQKVKDWLMSRSSRRSPSPPPHRANQASASASSPVLSNCPNCGTNVRLEHAKFGIASHHQAFTSSAYHEDDQTSDDGLGGGNGLGGGYIEYPVDEEWKALRARAAATCGAPMI